MWNLGTNYCWCKWLKNLHRLNGDCLEADSSENQAVCSLILVNPAVLHTSQAGFPSPCRKCWLLWGWFVCLLCFSRVIYKGTPTPCLRQKTLQKLKFTLGQRLCSWTCQMSGSSPGSLSSRLGFWERKLFKDQAGRRNPCNVSHRLKGLESRRIISGLGSGWLTCAPNSKGGLHQRGTCGRHSACPEIFRACGHHVLSAGVADGHQWQSVRWKEDGLLFLHGFGFSWWIFHVKSVPTSPSRMSASHCSNLMLSPFFWGCKQQDAQLWLDKLWRSPHCFTDAEPEGRWCQNFSISYPQAGHLMVAGWWPQFGQWPPEITDFLTMSSGICFFFSLAMLFQVLGHWLCLEAVSKTRAMGLAWSTRKRSESFCVGAAVGEKARPFQPFSHTFV